MYVVGDKKLSIRLFPSKHFSVQNSKNIKKSSYWEAPCDGVAIEEKKCLLRNPNPLSLRDVIYFWKLGVSFLISRRTGPGLCLLAAPGIKSGGIRLVFLQAQGILVIGSLSEGPVSSFPSCVAGITARWIPAPIPTNLFKPMK